MENKIITIWESIPKTWVNYLISIKNIKYSNGIIIDINLIDKKLLKAKIVAEHNYNLVQDNEISKLLNFTQEQIDNIYKNYDIIIKKD